MSDRFSGEIWIGGQVSRPKTGYCCERDAPSVLNGLIGEIDAAGVSHAWGDAFVSVSCCGPLSETELLQYLDDGLLYFCNDQAVNGEFQELEGFCRENGIPFRRVSNHYCEYDAEEVIFVPGHDEITRIVGAGCKPLVDGDKVREVIKTLTESMNRRRVATSGSRPDGWLATHVLEPLKRLCPDIPTIPKFEIVD